MKLFKILVAVAAPVITAVIKPEALINLGLGLITKHCTPIPNNLIPYLNGALTTGCFYVKNSMVTHDWIGSIVPSMQQAGVLAGISQLTHQAMKIPMKSVTGKSL